MPTILLIGPYRFYFYSHEQREPPHIHVDRDLCSAKFWLTKISLAKNIGFKPKELAVLETLVAKNKKQFLDAWDEYFNF